MAPAGSTRWCPTPEQLMMLEEMYRGGIRTPSATQIQQITAHLSLYGKIEGKNVFYWFQNHKARDRQKLRRKLMLIHQHHQQLLYKNSLHSPPLHQLSHNNSGLLLVRQPLSQLLYIYFSISLGMGVLCVGERKFKKVHYKKKGLIYHFYYIKYVG